MGASTNAAVEVEIQVIGVEVLTAGDLRP